MKKELVNISTVSFLPTTDSSQPGNLRHVTVKKREQPPLLNLFANSGMNGMFQCFVNTNILHLMIEHNILG